MPVKRWSKVTQAVVYSLLVGLTLLSAAVAFGVVRGDRLPRLVRGIGAPDGSGAALAGAGASLTGGGGGTNSVNAVNQCTDGRLRVRASVALAQIPAPRVAPSNSAQAQSSGQGCQTYGLAVQVAIYERGASTVAPTNSAVAVNYNCTGCVTVARAIQYVIPVDSLSVVPADIDALYRDLDRQAKEIERTATSISEAHERLNGVVAQHRAYVQYLKDETQQSTESVTATPTATSSASATPAPTATVQPTAGAATETPAPTAAAPTDTPAPTAAVATETPAPTAVAPTETPAPTATVQPTVAATATP